MSLARYERTSTRTTRLFGHGPFLGRKWAWIGDSITNGQLGSLEAKSCFPNMVTNFFGAEITNIAAGARTLSSFLAEATGSADPVSAGSYVGEWYRNTTSSEQFFWTGSVWQQRKAGQSGTGFIADRRTQYNSMLADSSVEFVVISMTATNDIVYWVNGTYGRKDEFSPWHYKKQLEQLVTEIYATGKTIIFVCGARAEDSTYHLDTDASSAGSRDSRTRLAMYNAAYREVADANDILCVDIGYIFHSEFAQVRWDINLRNRYSQKPSIYTTPEWSAILTSEGISDAYAGNKDEVLDHYYEDTGNPVDLVTGMTNQHPNEWGHFIIAQEIIRAVTEFGI